MYMHTHILSYFGFQGFEYSRSGNPTRNVLEKCLAALDGAKYGLTFSSGLGTSMTLFSMLSAGDHIVVGDDVYGGTARLIRCNEFIITF